MQKIYQRINWENDPSTNTPLSEDNLNKMDYALDKIDDRVVSLSGYEERVKISEENAKTSEDNAKESELKAKEYAEQAQESAENVGDLIVPKGDITFEELSTVSAKTGYMYKITNDFYSDETFADGGGKFYLAGTKVYMNKDGLWELLTSTSGDAAGASDIAIPLLIDNWVLDEENDEYIQTVSISGLREESSPLIVPSPVGDSLTEEELSAYNCLKNDIHIEVGLITFRAYKIPSISFTVIAKGASATGDAVATVTALVAKVSELEAEVDANASTITKLNSDLSTLDKNAIKKNNANFSAGLYHSKITKSNKQMINALNGDVWVGNPDLDNVVFEYGGKQVTVAEIIAKQEETATNLENKVTNNFTASRVLVSNSNGKATASSSITATELGYLDGVTSKIQPQINALSEHFVSSGIINNSNVNVTLENNSFYFVMLSSGTENLLYLVYTYNSTIVGVRLNGTPVDTNGSRFGIVPNELVLGIYSQTRISTHAVIRIN